MVTLDEYGIRGLGHNGVVDYCLHHCRVALEHVVGVGRTKIQKDMPCHDYT